MKSCSASWWFHLSIPQRYINKNRVRYRYLHNEVSCQQLFCCICFAISWPNLGNLLITLWVMPNETTRWWDVCNKKPANFWLHPPPMSLDIYSALYFYLCISVVNTKQIVHIYFLERKSLPSESIQKRCLWVQRFAKATHLTKKHKKCVRKK